MQVDPLLPGRKLLGVAQVQIQPVGVAMELLSTAASAACPVCGQASRRVHSHYTRRLKDLPWHGAPVMLHVRVRRFFCDNPGCRRGIFSERLGQVARAYGRTTERLADALAAIGLTCGGEAGSRLAGRLGMGASPDYLLDAIRREPVAPPHATRVLGVDDWAFRRGDHYGTILCDLEEHRPIDLLPERTNECLAEWLKGHPGVEVISRDRADGYAQGASAGAPQAQQVADRWHLMHNLHDALVRIAARCHEQVAAAAKGISAKPAPPQTDLPDEPIPTGSAEEARPATQAELAKQAHRARRLATYERVMELHHQGRSQRSIAQELDLSRDLVHRFVRAGSFPERARPVRSSGAGAHLSYLRQRWAEGCRNAKTLTHELKSRGAKLSYFSVRRVVARWRDKPWSRESQNGTATGVGRISVPSSNRVAWLLQRSEEELESDELELAERLRDLCPDLCNGADLVREFTSLIHERRADDLDAWIALASEPPAPAELTAFAQGLTKDYAAVSAAAASPWSNGQVEGQINRLKLIKRQMYGRANFDLLRRRVLATG